jgi:hypothetical protein
MLQLLKVIFPYLIALYLLDCISYLNKHQFIIGTIIGKRFSLKKKGVHFLGLLPSSQIYLAQNLPIVFAIEGMYYVSYDTLNDIGIYRERDFSFLPYKEISQIEIDEKSLKYKDKIIIKGPSNLYIRNLRKFLHLLNSIKPNDRNLKISNYLSKLYNISEVVKIKKDSAPHLLKLYITTFILFSLVFVLIPFTIYSNLYLYLNLYVLVVYVLIIYLFILYSVAKLNKKLFQPNKGIRTLSFFSLIFSPINTIHASIYITKNLYHSFDLITLAAVFLKGNSFKKIARREYLSIKKLQTKKNDKSWHDYWEKKEGYLLEVIKTASFTLKEIMAPPDKQDGNAEKYCPICLTEYTSGPTHCVDCETGLENFTN